MGSSDAGMNSCIVREFGRSAFGRKLRKSDHRIRLLYAVELGDAAYRQPTNPLRSKLLILTVVRYFTDFTPDNDPHGEHDCAVLRCAGTGSFGKSTIFPPTGL
jgi:hypothetical protein